MKQVSDAFIRWFCDVLTHEQRINTLEEIINKGLPLCDKKLRFMIDNKGDPFNFEAAIFVEDHSFVDKLKIGLSDRSLQTYPAAWGGSDGVHVGAVCKIDDEIVALMSTGDFVSIVIGSEHFEVTINGRL